MNSFEFKHYGNDIVAYNKSLFEEFPTSLFDPTYLSSHSLLLTDSLNANQSQGRGGIYIFKYDSHDLVLRHYYRGGQISKFNKDAYIWKGLDKTRAVKELNLLSLMCKNQLPVPEPIAAHISRSGLIYTANIVTKLIPNTQSISAKLMQDDISEEDWSNIGAVIRKFHDFKIKHADLNAHNILIDNKGVIFLIDFDKSKIDQSNNSWQQKNLQRLQRSLIKLKTMNVNFNYSEQKFNALLQGYN